MLFFSSNILLSLGNFLKNKYFIDSALKDLFMYSLIFTFTSLCKICLHYPRISIDLSFCLFNVHTTAMLYILKCDWNLFCNIQEHYY